MNSSKDEVKHRLSKRGPDILIRYGAPKRPPPDNTPIRRLQPAGQQVQQG